MKKVILISAIALLAACGSTKADVSVGADNTSPSAGSVASGGSVAPAGSVATADTTITSIAGSDDTITVENFGDMPPKCIDLLAAFLKQIEPTVSTIDWDKATLGDFQAFGDKFKTESDAFDTQTAAAGCDKYNLNGSDEKQFEQMAALATAEAPGTLGFIKFLSSLKDVATASTGSIPADCASTIAAIEPFLAKGTMTSLTMAEVAQLSPLMSGVSTNCSSDEASAFFAREDVTAFVGA